MLPKLIRIKLKVVTIYLLDSVDNIYEHVSTDLPYRYIVDLSNTHIDINKYDTTIERKCDTAYGIASVFWVH